MEQGYSISCFQAPVDFVLGMRDSNPSRHRNPILVFGHVSGLQSEAASHKKSISGLQAQAYVVLGMRNSSAVQF